MKKCYRKLVPALCLALALMGCGNQTTEETSLTTQPTSETTLATQPTTEPVEQLREVVYAQLENFLYDWAENCWEAEEEPRETIRVTGLSTPVEVTLEGLTVKTIQAYGRTLPVEIASDEGDVAMSLKQWQDTLIINGNGSSWLLTPEQTFDFPEKDGVITWLRVGDNEELEYHKSAYAAQFMEQWATGPLDSATDRGNLYSEEGTITLQDGQPVLTMMDRTLIGHVYDFDALFTLARLKGWNEYEGCENADDVLKQNKEAGETWLTYPYEPKEPAQRIEFEGLTLNLPQEFTQETTEEGTLILRGQTSGYEDVVLRVTTGEAEQGYQDLTDPITSPAQMLDWDWANRGSKSAASFSLHNVPCLNLYDDETENIRGYYLKDNRWWVIEVEDCYVESMLIYATCGTIQ